MTGTLYIVATPIGNLGDMVPRAVDILQSVDVVAAEDTRHSARLLRSFGIRAPLVSCHDYNERRRADELITRIVGGQNVALISDAGTPLISDPGFPLVRCAHAAGVAVSPVPGPCAAIAALSVAGIPSDRFSFEGFLPAKPGARRARLEALKREPATLIFYEAPHRVIETLADLRDVFGDGRDACVARELTKRYESVRTGSLAGLCDAVASVPEAVRGEFVLVVAGAPALPAGLTDSACEAMQLLCEDLPVKRAAAIAAQLFGLRRKVLYDWYVGRGEQGT